jgi:Icc-related predicted phosphoesterase
MSTPIRIAAVADLHYTTHCKGRLQSLFVHASSVADVLCVCGDLTDYGLPEEAAVLAHDLETHLTIPCLAVLGNHDFESGRAPELIAEFDRVGVQILDGGWAEIGGVHFAGVPGFGGGFDARMLNSWGEPLIKAFVQEAIDQALRLEKALARVETPRKVALMHYSPIRATIVGEDPEVFAFLGSTRLEGPVNRQAAAVAFHGHAHNGCPEGKTASGVPVYNVSMPVLQRLQPDKPPLRIIEI